MERQGEIFEEAKRSIASELGGEILSWDFSRMLSELRLLIESRSAGHIVTRDSIRHFCRHYLDMRGQSFTEMRGWLSGAAEMPSERIQLVLRALQSALDGKLFPGLPGRYEISEPKPFMPEASGMKRTLLEYFMATLSQLRIVIGVTEVNPRDLFDGDRIQMRITIKAICNAFGIEVIFPEPGAAQNQPVTRHDLGLNRTEFADASTRRKS